MGAIASVSSQQARFFIRAVVEEVRLASSWVQDVCVQSGIPAADILRLDLCLNEVLANIIFHGGAEAVSAPIELRLNITDWERSGCVELLVSDTGVPFDPISAVEKAQQVFLEEVTPGGLGIVMLKGYLDELSYAYQDGRNCLRMVIHKDKSLL